MNHATPPLRSFAASLISHEAQVTQPAPTEAPTAVPVVARLRPVLATLMGRDGFRGLLSRALVLAWIEVPWLKDVQVTADGSLENFAEAAARLKPDQAAEGSVVLVARLFGLLEAFIGESLTLRLILEIWPDIPQDDDFTLGETHEETN